MHNEKVTMLPKGTISLSEYIYSWSKPNNASVTVYFKQTLRANTAFHFRIALWNHGKWQIDTSLHRAQSKQQQNR